MSAYENVTGGKLRLKGKALDVKAGGGLKKKKKKKQKLYDQIFEANGNDPSADGDTGTSKEDVKQQDDDDAHKSSIEGGGTVAAAAVALSYDDHHLTPAERRYMEQKEKIDVHRLAKIANKSHRDRIQDFNQYLANMSEHYDIPKVGPG